MVASCATGVGGADGQRATLMPTALEPSRAGGAGRKTPSAIGAAGSEKRDRLGWCTAERLRMQEMHSAGAALSALPDVVPVEGGDAPPTPKLGYAYLFNDPEPSPSTEPAQSQQALASSGMGARGWTERSAKKGERSSSRR